MPYPRNAAQVRYKEKAALIHGSREGEREREREKENHSERLGLLIY